MKYHSKAEAQYAARLDLLMHAQKASDRVVRFERQCPCKLMVNDRLICTYIVDFFVYYADGRKEAVEVKGYWTPEAKLKKKLFEATWLAEHPEIKYVIES